MGASRKYDWEGLFIRPHTVLVRGIHYDCSQSTMVQMIRNNASRRGLRVRVQDNCNYIVVEMVNDDGWREWRRSINAVPRPNQAPVPC